MGHWTLDLDIGPDDQPKKIKKNQKKNQNKITFIYAPYYTIMELLHWTLDLTINPKKSKKKIKKKIKIKSLYLCTILYNYGTSSLDIGPDDQPKKIKKKSKKKIKIKSPLSMHHTTQLWNFFIGHRT